MVIFDRRGFLLFIAMSLVTTAAFSADSDRQISVKKLSPTSTQVTVSGRGLQSMLGELNRTGIDPEKLNTLDPEGHVISLYSPEVTDLQWKRTSIISTPVGAAIPEDLADGTGTPYQIQNDVITTHDGGTITVTTFTWEYLFNSSTGQWGWVALGQSSVSYQVRTDQK